MLYFDDLKCIWDQVFGNKYLVSENENNWPINKNTQY